MNGPQSCSQTIRRAHAGDAARIAEIFNQGVADRVATFETTPATPGEAEGWIASDIVVVADRAGTSVAWAKASAYADPHHYYDGVREGSMSNVGRGGPASAESSSRRSPTRPPRKARTSWLGRSSRRTNPASRW